LARLRVRQNIFLVVWKISFPSIQNLACYEFSLGILPNAGLFGLCSTTQCPPHHTAKLTSRSDILISVFTQSRLHPRWKTSWAIVFTHIHFMRCISSVVNHIDETTLLLTFGLHRCYKEYLGRIQIIFMLLESAFY